MKLSILLLSFVALAVQATDPNYDSDGHLKLEHQIPAGHYCQTTRVYEENLKRLLAAGKDPKLSSAHPCDCTYTCHVDANGDMTETGGEKGTGCKSYCSKDGRRCTCHVEEPCDLGSHVARVDMNGKIVSVTR